MVLDESLENGVTPHYSGENRDSLVDAWLEGLRDVYHEHLFLNGYGALDNMADEFLEGIMRESLMKASHELATVSACIASMSKAFEAFLAKEAYDEEGLKDVERKFLNSCAVMEDLFLNVMETDLADESMKGAAHDCNNMLSIFNIMVKFYVESLHDGAEAKAKESLECLVCSLGRLRDVLAPYKSEVDQVESLESIENILLAIRRDAVNRDKAYKKPSGPQVVVTLDLSENAAMTEVTAVKVWQIVNNLVTNALQALAKNIKISAFIDDNGQSGAKQSVVVLIEDDGAGGLDKDTVFGGGLSTKEGSANTHGIGLSYCKVLAQDIGGDLVLVRSNTEAKVLSLGKLETKGTVFKLSIPLK